MAEKNVVFAGEVTLPAIGQGTWYMGENDRKRSKEVDALRAGIDAGLRLIDTAEMYADGGAEEVVGAALQGGLRDKIYLVSKVYPWNAGGEKAIASENRLSGSLSAALARKFLAGRNGGGDGNSHGAGQNSPLGSIES